MIPEFCVIDDLNGDVIITFIEQVDDSLYYYIYDEINKRVLSMEKDYKDMYHLEFLIGGLLSNAILQKGLRRDPRTQKWII